MTCCEVGKVNLSTSAFASGEPITLHFARTEGRTLAELPPRFSSSADEIQILHVIALG